MIREMYTDAQECVCFLGTEDSEERRQYQGTAFWVSIPSEDGQGNFPYLVTARHCVERGRQAQNFFVRVNNEKGGSDLFNAMEGWVFPDDPAVDIAVLQVCFDADIPHKVIPPELFATPDVIERDHIGVGDDVLVVGLFSLRSGVDRNHPIVRTGIIASMVDEPFIDDGGQEYKAFLAEVRSIGGLSGSPVFAKYRMTDRKPMMRHCVGDEAVRLALIGVVRGHFDLRRRTEADDAATDEVLNMGICLVTPVTELHGLLMSEEQKEFRRKVIESTPRA